MWCDSSICVTRDPELVRSKNTPAYVDCCIQPFKHLASEQFYTTMYIHTSKYHHRISDNFCYFEAFSNCSTALDITNTMMYLFPPTGLISSSCLIVLKYRWLCENAYQWMDRGNKRLSPCQTLEAFTCESSLL